MFADSLSNTLPSSASAFFPLVRPREKPSQLEMTLFAACPPLFFFFFQLLLSFQPVIPT